MIKKYFRFDDVCINADMNLVYEMTEYLKNRFSDCDVIWGISPLVHDMSNEPIEKNKQRIFPKILNAHSDYRVFYNVDKVGIPKLIDGILIASHGLIHVDHRLLSKEAQEMSILISTGLVNSKLFIPPFNKWNKDTETICLEHNINLIKFEDGWLCMEYNEYNDNHDKWYLHAREFTMDKFKKWFEK